MESGQISFLGNPVPGTFCDREFLDCHSNRRCRIRTPNFPGFYPRNVTCHFYIRHPKAPEFIELLQAPPAQHWYAAKSPGLSIQCRSSRAHQTALTRLRSGHLRSMTFVQGVKSFFTCPCSFLASPAHLLDYRGISLRQLYEGLGYTARIVLSQPNDYKISVPTGRATSTSGASFLLSTDCISGDSVRIFDGPSTRSPQLLEFCGSGSLPEIISSSNELLVQIYSAPYQHLSNSRVEVEVSVRYEMFQSETPEDNGRCSYTMDGTKRRWGLIHSPRHTMPPNTNCTYRLIGASKHDRVRTSLAIF
ncbi:uncharacterized protein TNCV_1803911 [Trichonephila clavipes]|nr:uncharacterized protein TNCV_1803911 [Trichonephila clavipes]